MIKQQPIFLDRVPCSELKGAGSKITSYLERLCILNIQDLLFHLPLRYEDRTFFKPLNHLQTGDHVQVTGEITHIAIKEGRRKSMIVRLEDDAGYLFLRFFHYHPAQYQQLSRIGLRLRCYGEVRSGINGYEMIHPEYSLLKEQDAQNTIDTLTPIYPTTEGLHQYTLRKLIDQALQLLNQGAQLVEYLPSLILEQFKLPNLVAAIQYVHRPPKDASQELLQQKLHPVQQRLVFEELLAHQVSLARIKLRTGKLQGPKINSLTNLANRLINTLPFSLTSSQKAVIDDITHDLKSGIPMLRLIQGDVGSGKTVVAAITACYLIDTGFQVAVMAPTELLAEQHYKNFSTWFDQLGIKVTWLTGTMRGKARDEILQKVKLGEYQIIIGTHALFQKEVHFANLGMIIIDEQHRFGVHQRLELLNKGIHENCYPHQMIMSATPIPRTLAMTAYADLDCSTIDELPPGRMPVKTIVIPNSNRPQLINRIKENCLAGAQAYWVCTLIQESEALQCQAAEEITKELTAYLPMLRIDLVHGRMKSRDKEKIMLAFKNKEIDLLVATTVIEVGVDVPNASLMVIENSERLGLAQLHQLRGRVGRGAIQSHCVLMYQSPLSRFAKERLAVLREYTDGFVIAEKDLELRGPGEVLGTKQTGLVQFKIADLSRDQHQLPSIQKATEILLQHFPQCVDHLIDRWLADKTQFCEV